MRKIVTLVLSSLVAISTASAAVPGFNKTASTTVPCISVTDNADFRTEADCLYFLQNQQDYNLIEYKASSTSNRLNNGRMYVENNNQTNYAQVFGYWRQPYNQGDCWYVQMGVIPQQAQLGGGQYDVTSPDNVWKGYVWAFGGNSNAYYADTTYAGCATSLGFATSSKYILESDGYTYENSTSTNSLPPCTENCNSNIVFIPGLMGSRLYDPTCDPLGNVCASQKWLPLTDNEIRDLYLKGDGTSVNQNIVTKDIVDSAVGVKPLYKSFIDDMATWKSSGLVADATSTPYDWRLSIDDVVNKGVRVGDGYISYNQAPTNGDNPYILDTILKSASSSRTGKVTLVAHSNGGLVAKVIMQKLRSMGKEDIVDTIILVASPQIGTPDAGASLLHGSCLGEIKVSNPDIRLGCLISDPAETRGVAKNMPAAYNLLPSDEFFNTQFAQDISPLAFYGNANTDDASLYGIEVKDASHYRQYLKGTDGRPDPNFNDIDSPSVANAYLLNQASALHDSLDVWRPASTTKVIEIAGFGVYTIAGLHYVTVQECKLTINGCTYLPKVSVDNQLTINGDETVVSPSAHYLSTKTGDIDRWYLNLQGTDKTHKDILEDSELRHFIRNTVTHSTSTYTNLLNQQTIPTTNQEYYKIGVHSPLNIHLYDIFGNHTGLTASSTLETNIPGSQYFEVGTVKTIIAPKANLQKVELDAYANGSFTVDQEIRTGDTILSSSSVQAIPTATSTLVTIPLNQLNLTESTVQVDYDGNGSTDFVRAPKQGSVVIYDQDPPELFISFSTSTKQFLWNTVDNIDPNPTLTSTTNTVTTVDNQGNTTTLAYKPKYEGKSLKLDILSITRNSITTPTDILLKLEYSLDNKTNQIKELEYKITLQDKEMYKIKYQKETNMTTIKSRTNTITKEGLQLPDFITSLNTLSFVN